MSQRRRLEGLLADLSEDEWQHPSRCAGWTRAGRRHPPDQHQRVLGPVDRGRGPRRADRVPGRLRSRGVAGPARGRRGRARRWRRPSSSSTASTAALGAVIEGLADGGLGAPRGGPARAPPGAPGGRSRPLGLLGARARHRAAARAPRGRRRRRGAHLPALRAPRSGRAFEVCGRPSRAGHRGARGAAIPTRRRGHHRRRRRRPHPRRPRARRRACAVAGDAVALLEMLSTRDVGAPVPDAVARADRGARRRVRPDRARPERSVSASRTPVEGGQRGGVAVGGLEGLLEPACEPWCRGGARARPPPRRRRRPREGCAPPRSGVMASSTLLPAGPTYSTGRPAARLAWSFDGLITPRRAVVQRDEREVGPGHHRRASRPWARSRGTRRW